MILYAPYGGKVGICQTETEPHALGTMGHFLVKVTKTSYPLRCGEVRHSA